MTDKGVLKLGIIGMIVAALCCFAPVLVTLLGAVALSAAIGWTDYILVSVLLFFVILIVFALWKRRSLT